jgi:hypothetical protein
MDTKTDNRFCGMLKGLLKAIKIIPTFKGKQNHSSDEKNHMVENNYSESHLK